jgi:hypothetical protein
MDNPKRAKMEEMYEIVIDYSGSFLYLSSAQEFKILFDSVQFNIKV